MGPIPGTRFAWEIRPPEHGTGGPGGVCGDRAAALAALTVALLDQAPGAVGELWRVRPSLVRPAEFVYDRLLVRGERDGGTSVRWR